MAKNKIRYLCRECGYKSPVSLGRCPNCDAWDSFGEEITEKVAGRGPRLATENRVRRLSEVPKGDTERISTSLSELDRVLGGGLVPGAVILLSGEPGVGKSTLLLQVADGAAKQGKKLLYVTGEESPAQVCLRAERLGLETKGIHVLSETELPAVLEEAKNDWDILVVDSVQTLRLPELGGAAGSPGQIRESAAMLATLAKDKGMPLFLVGHITKEGNIAGPKLLEHLVDTVLYFEGEKDRPVRILRSFKNRFGPVNELGVFEMTGEGLGEVRNPSALFLAERPHGAAGSVVTPVIEGRRPLLLEIQALVSPSPLPMPRRQTLGADPSRVSMLAAVLEKKVRLKLFDRDIFVNVAGGVKIQEPSADLAIVFAIASSCFECPLPQDLAVTGEVGLAGEIRRVGRLEDRLREASRMGFKQVCGPAAELGECASGLKMRKHGMEHVKEIFGPNPGFFRKTEGGKRDPSR
ncbi:MAG: DNA repair protein RadA [Deltaproteobacteria bacterium]|jgi:DNA repair protein RadA/Sms|nr:DNA repair protein RadA [Deltaproteobacteria bacterium]